MQAPYTQQFFSETFATLLDEHPDIQFIYHHRPMAFYANSTEVAIVAECLALQNQFWNNIETLSQNLKRLSSSSLDFIASADTKKLYICVNDPFTKRRVEISVNDADHFGIQSVPTLIVQSTDSSNPFRYSIKILGAQHIDIFEQAIDEVMGKVQQKAEAETKRDQQQEYQLEVEEQSNPSVAPARTSLISKIQTSWKKTIVAPTPAPAGERLTRYSIIPVQWKMVGDTWSWEFATTNELNSVVEYQENPLSGGKYFYKVLPERTVNGRTIFGVWAYRKPIDDHLRSGYTLFWPEDVVDDVITLPSLDAMRIKPCSTVNVETSLRYCIVGLDRHFRQSAWWNTNWLTRWIVYKLHPNARPYRDLTTHLSAYVIPDHKRVVLSNPCSQNIITGYQTMGYDDEKGDFGVLVRCQEGKLFEGVVSFPR